MSIPLGACVRAIRLPSAAPCTMDVVQTSKVRQSSYNGYSERHVHRGQGTNRAPGASRDRARGRAPRAQRPDAPADRRRAGRGRRADLWQLRASGHEVHLHTPLQGAPRGRPHPAAPGRYEPPEQAPPRGPRGALPRAPRDDPALDLDSPAMADLKPVYLVAGDDDVKIDAWRA